MLRLLLTGSKQNSAAWLNAGSSLQTCAERWCVQHVQSAAFTQSAVRLAGPPSTAQLQQQQSKQQFSRHQQQPAQQQQSDHLRALQADPALCRKVLVNRLLYRSRQRGFLEMDLLVGIWAEKQVPVMSEDMLHQFEAVLDQENPDLYKWLTGQQSPPAAMADNGAYQALLRDVSLQLQDHIDKSARAPEGKEWVRGWDDWNKASQTPVKPGPLADK